MGHEGAVEQHGTGSPLELVALVLHIGKEVGEVADNTLNISDALEDTKVGQWIKQSKFLKGIQTRFLV